MGKRIRVSAGFDVMYASMAENGAANAIWDALQIDADASIWGDEIYFGIPAHLERA